MGTIRILSFDGGGIGGKLSARLARHLEKDLGALCDHFHFIVGSSAGALNAAALSKVNGAPLMRASELDDMHTQEGGSIFDRSLWKTFKSVNGYTDPKYDPDNLSQIVNRITTDKKLSDVDSRLIVTGFELENKCPIVFKSWKAKGVDYDPLKTEEKPENRDAYLYDVMMGTTAAPTYFPPHEMTNMADRRFTTIDGGVWANNPAQVGLSAARNIFGDVHDIVVISIGTGHMHEHIDARSASDWGALQWIKPAIDILMHGSSESVNYHLRQQDKHVKYHRLQVNHDLYPDLPPVSPEMDDGSLKNIQALEAHADHYIEENRTYLDKVKNYLAYVPKDDFNLLLQESRENFAQREKRRDPIWDFETPAPPAHEVSI